jgi:acyl carrier protein
MEKITEEIKSVIEDVAGIPANEIENDSSFMDDLDLASLEIMAMVAEIEKKFSIRLAESEMLSIENIAELAELVESKIKK